MTVKRTPDHRGANEIRRENHCVRECRVFRSTCGDDTRVLPPHFAHEAAGAAGTRHSPRPLLGETFLHGSGASRREIADAYLKLAPCSKARHARPCARPSTSWLQE